MSNETDLDWLARNVHVWREGKREVLVCWPRNVDTLIWSYVLSDTGWITKDQWLTRRAELQNKPSWNDAPEWAGFLGQDDDGVWFWHGEEPNSNGEDANGCLYWMSHGLSDIACRGELLGDWRDTLEKRPYISVTNCTVTSLGSFGVTVGAPADLSEQAVTARLQEATDNVLAAAKELKYDKYKFDPFISIEDNQGQEMNHDKGWFERGELPPVGSECIFEHGSGSCYFNEYDLKASGEVVKIIAHTRYKHSSCDVAVFRWDLDGCFGVSTGNTKAFRPIRTEREAAIDRMQSDIAERWANCEELARHLVDKGWVKGGK